jgi:hypothetical protein
MTLTTQEYAITTLSFESLRWALFENPCYEKLAARAKINIMRVKLDIP